MVDLHLSIEPSIDHSELRWTLNTDGVALALMNF